MNLKSEIFLLVLTVWCISSSRAQETSNCDGFNTIIDIVSNVTDCQKDPSTPNRWQCHSLEAAFAIYPKKPLTDTCIHITKDANHHFTNAIVSNARKLKITSHDMFTFQCGPGQFLSFIYGDNIEIENLKFDGSCGGAQTSTYIHNDPFYMNSQTLLSVHITAVFHFENVTDITLNNIDMNSYDGYGISMTDCIGHISLTKSTLQSNRPVYFQFEKSSEGTIYGGGVLFRHISRKTLKGAFFTISNTTLTNLTGYPDETALEKESKPYEPFGYGGAISLSFHKTSGNKINIINDDINDDTWITHNKALYGGAIYVKHGSDSSNNSILVKEIFCTHNTAVFSGGAFFYFTVEYPHTNDNSFTVDNLNELSSNTVLNGYGGAFCQRKQQSTGIHRSQFDPSLVKTFFYGGRGNISHNNAKIGSALFFDNVYVQFLGVVGLIDNSCTASKDGTLGFGAIYAYQSHLLVTSSSSEDAHYLSQNHATGIVLDFSDLHLRGNLDLYSNKGINGGGMALHGRSQIIIESTTAFLDIDSNFANKGAGISVDFNGPLIGEWETYLTPVYPCFFKFLEQAVNGRKPQVRFNNNKAVLFSGHENDIFTTSLRTCSSSSESADLLDFFNDKDKFNFTSKNSIATEPVEIYIPDNKVWQNMYPGTTMTVPIELRDEIGQPVSATVNMDIISRTEVCMLRRKIITNHLLSVTTQLN
uniref:Uncharacterized protein n=1 Tax=Clytia hemisphaerica TaxID=252671 RepID=A0A7M5U6K3_9CNID